MREEKKIHEKKKNGGDKLNRPQFKLKLNITTQVNISTMKLTPQKNKNKLKSK